MTDRNGPRSILRTIGRGTLAVLLGYLVVAVLTMAMTWGLIVAFGISIDPETGGPLVQPSAAFSLVNLALSVAIAGFGGYVTAMIVPRRELLHAFILGGAMFVIGAGYQIGQLLSGVRSDAPAEPLWYLLLLPVLSLPAVIAGGWLRARHLALRHEAPSTDRSP